MWKMFPKVFYTIILLAFTHSITAFHWDISLALEFSTTSPLIIRGLEYEIPVY